MAVGNVKSIKGALKSIEKEAKEIGRIMNVGNGKGKPLTIKELRIAEKLIKKYPVKPFYIKVSIWQAIKYKLKGFRIRLIK